MSKVCSRQVFKLVSSLKEKSDDEHGLLLCEQRQSNKKSESINCCPLINLDTFLK